tara:strand:+ start:1424 stop:1723 length:300 start_codon:yes stop_codon:yes gene_type:complete
MSTRITGRAREGRRIASNATGVGSVKPIEIKAATGDASTANSATPFFKFTAESASTTDGDVPVTTADVTGGGAAPGGTSKAILVDVKGTQYWIPIYATT